ncbi:Sestrin [Trinorchestia longiramus]|nr:Sestrin [Trinorchestia longiramus]
MGRSLRSSTVLPGLQPADDCGYKHFPHHLPDEESPKIRSTFFRWIDYGFDTTRRFLGEAVTGALDERFCAATSLSHCLDARGCAVQPPRHRNGACHKPVWRQVQWMCGVLYDDYDYKLLRKTMPLHLQKLIRTATCFPHRLCSVRRSPLSMQDVQLVCSQIMDCRMQCEVLFAVRAMLDYCSMVRH